LARSGASPLDSLLVDGRAFIDAATFTRITGRTSPRGMRLAPADKLSLGGQEHYALDKVRAFVATLADEGANLKLQRAFPDDQFVEYGPARLLIDDEMPPEVWNDGFNAGTMVRALVVAPGAGQPVWGVPARFVETHISGSAAGAGQRALRRLARGRTPAASAVRGAEEVKVDTKVKAATKKVTPDTNAQAGTKATAAPARLGEPAPATGAAAAPVRGRRAAQDDSTATTKLPVVKPAPPAGATGSGASRGGVFGVGLAFLARPSPKRSARCFAVWWWRSGWARVMVV